MSAIGGSPIETSLLQTAQAQQVAGKARDRERAEVERGRRRGDQVDLRVAGVEGEGAIRKLPRNDSEEARDEHDRAGQDPNEPPPGNRRIDVQA